VDLLDHARFLAGASSALVSSIDYPVTLRRVAELPVPALADLAVLDLVGLDGATVRVHVTHADPGDAHRAERLRRMASAAMPKRTLVIPLIVADRRLGALTLAQTVSGRDFDERVAATAEELGRISAMAIAHAELFCQRELLLARERAALAEVNAQRAKLRDLEERRRLAVESAAIGTFDYDPLSGALRWDTRCKEMFGLPPEAAIDFPGFLAAVHPDDRERIAAAVAATLAPDGDAHFDTEFRAIGIEDGAVRWIRATGQAFFDEADQAIRFIGSVQDIGYRKHIEAELEDARLRSEAANRAKDEFLAMLGHELRNPLAPILTALELMRMRAPDALVRERATLERQVKHLVRLVDDLLDVSRITRGKVELKCAPVALAEIAARAIEMASPLLESRGHRLVHDIPPALVVDADEARVAQILSNLLTNAARYTEPGGTIELHGERRGDQIAIAVRDSGLGISQELLPRIFDLFVQGERRIDRAEGGLGLGLAIARSLAEAHGGSIEAASDGLGKGSTFTVRLPRASTAELELDKKRTLRLRSSDLEGPSPRVLIVDDNRDAAEVLAEALEATGFRTCVAFDAPQALDRAITFRPHVAMLDIGLPVMDGYELARRLRELPALRDVKLVAVTGYGQEGDREHSARAGFTAHLVKPVALDDVTELLGRLAEEI
jgi:PAS domain S-box-containing protein